MPVILIIVGVLALILIGGLIFGTKGMKEIKEMPINNPDISKLADGTYRGEFHHARWNYNVEVQVKGGKITGIRNLTAGDMSMKPEMSAKLEKAVVDGQNVNLDSYSGATMDSKSFLKAVENALTKKD